MFRFLYTLSDVLGAVFAITSPVAITHWLVKAMGVSALDGFVNALNPVFDPLNAMVALVIKTPDLNFGGQPHSTAQGVLACLLTLGFFLLNFMAESLRASEQRLTVNQQANQQRQRLRKLQEEQKKKQHKLATAYDIYIHVTYDVLTCPKGGSLIEGAYGRYGGVLMENYGDCFTVKFAKLEQALLYATEASQALLSYYATLRPIDPQPPFRISIHALDAEISEAASMAETRKLVKFVAANQVIFSQEVRSILETSGLGMAYRYQSIGLYAIEGVQVELFRLFFNQAANSSL